MNKRNQKALGKFEAKSFNSGNDKNHHTNTYEGSQQLNFQKGQFKGPVMYSNKNKSPSCSSDDSTSSGGKRRYPNSANSYYNNQNQGSYGSSTHEQMGGSMHDQELKRRRVEIVSRREYVSQVTKNVTFSPCLPTFFQQAASL